MKAVENGLAIEIVHVTEESRHGSWVSRPMLKVCSIGDVELQLRLRAHSWVGYELVKMYN